MENCLCDYGCGQEAIYQFKNGKWCCSQHFSQCIIIRKKMGISKSGENNPKGMLGKHPSIETRKKMRENHADLRTPFKEIIKFVEDEGYQLLSKEMDYKNQFSYLWFRCPEGHEFPMRYDAFKSGQRCPECKSEKQSQRMRKHMKNRGSSYIRSFIKKISKPQLELFNLVKELYPETILEYQCLNYFIDIVIPNLKIAIEYDGSYWHQGREEYDDKRQKEIENEGWKFLRYRDYVPSKEELKKDIYNYEKRLKDNSTKTLTLKKQAL